MTVYASWVVRITVETEIAAPPDVVWADIQQISSHVEWMSDADTITFTSEQTQGVGATFDCVTKIGPIRLNDKMEITEWVEAETLGVRHKGLVSGEGQFTLSATDGDTTRFQWSEILQFPWWLGAGLGERIGKPILERIWQKNLQLLQSRFEPR